jgi:hypothetical protein
MIFTILLTMHNLDICRALTVITRSLSIEQTYPQIYTHIHPYLISYQEVYAHYPQFKDKLSTFFIHILLIIFKGK